MRNRVGLWQRRHRFSRCEFRGFRFRVNANSRVHSNSLSFFLVFFFLRFVFLQHMTFFALGTTSVRTFVHISSYLSPSLAAFPFAPPPPRFLPPLRPPTPSLIRRAPLHPSVIRVVGAPFFSPCCSRSLLCTRFRLQPLATRWGGLNY